MYSATNYYVLNAIFLNRKGQVKCGTDSQVSDGNK